MHRATERFHRIVQEIADLHDRKAQDYGTDEDPLNNVRAATAWGMPAWVGAMVRLTDKVKRLQALRTKGSLANESAIDSFRDIAVYAIIAEILFEEENDEFGAVFGKVPDWVKGGFDSEEQFNRATLYAPTG